MGKTHFTKNRIAGKNCFVYDVNNEYTELPIHVPEAFGKKGQVIRQAKTFARSRFSPMYGDDVDFMNECKKKVNTICVFEEATGFLMANTTKLFKGTLANKRHTNNYYILLFHTIATVPKFIFGMSNDIILFKTLDSLADVKKANPRLLQSYFTMQEQANPVNKYIHIKN